MNRVKNITVTFDCTEEQQKQFVETAKKNNTNLIFSKDEADILNSEIIIGEPDIDVIKKSSKLEWIQMTWAGTDKYTVNAGFPKNVKLSNMSRAFGVIMAEYAIGAILYKYRLFSTYQKQQEASIWQDAGMDNSLYGKTVLFIGTGDICQNTAIRLKAFGTHNIGLKRTVSKGMDGFDELDLIENIDKWLPDADIVISAVPNKPETRMLLNKSRLLSMKKDATLLNMGRGSLLSCDELNEVLDMGHLGYVILDVTNPEPLPAEHPLWKQPKAFITPHISGKSLGHCPDTQQRIVDICCDNIDRFLNEKPILNEIKDNDFEYERS